MKIKWRCNRKKRFYNEEWKTRLRKTCVIPVRFSEFGAPMETTEYI